MNVVGTSKSITFAASVISNFLPDMTPGKLFIQLPATELAETTGANLTGTSALTALSYTSR